MRVTAKFTFVAGTLREYNGRQYANIDFKADGLMGKCSVDPTLLPKLEEFRQYEGTFEYVTYPKGSSALQLLSVKPL